VALRGDLGDQFEIEMVAPGVLAGAGDDLVIGERARRFPDELLLVGERKIHRRRTVSIRPPAGGTHLRRPHGRLRHPTPAYTRGRWTRSPSSCSGAWAG